MAPQTAGDLDPVGRDPVSMVTDLLWALLISCLLGFLSGIGTGGGSLLMLWLTVAMEYPHETARSINLLFFLPAALIACFFRRKQGLLSVKTVFPAIAAGCITAAVFSFLGMNWDSDVIKKIFGVLLVFTGLRELTYKEKKAS